jgi:homocysteine S-methyltransferase
MIDDRPPLPQLEHRPFLTDSGLETTFIFIDGIELPEFAAFPLLETSDGRRRLRHYFERHASIAREASCGFIAEAPTWRANPHWGRTLGYDSGELDAINKHAITLLADLRDRDGRGSDDYVISGCIGPRGDGYDPSCRVSAEDAERYHGQQIESFADTHADLVTALTLTHVEEAIGVTRAAQDLGMPAAISFTLETDGRLPSGTTLGEAILDVDEATRVPPTTWSTARTPRTSSTSSMRAARGSAGCAGSAQTPRKRAMPSSTPRPSLTRATRWPSVRSTPRWSPDFRS